MFVYYRISDKGRNPHANKYSCLLNAVHEFGKTNFYVIADNCSPKTINFLRKHKLIYEETSLGNTKSFIYILNKIIKRHAPEDIVYLLEDDYAHRPKSKKVLLEGINIADYVTLYDFPDKYVLASEWIGKIKGNALNYRKLQKTRLYVTATTHWREINSTTLTFSCRVKTLRRDYWIWKFFCGKRKIPSDFFPWVILTQRNLYELFLLILRRKKLGMSFFYVCFLIWRKPRKLISVLPGYSTHMDSKSYFSPFIKWHNYI